MPYPVFNSRLVRAVLILCFLLAPVAIVSLILAVCLQATLLDCYPYLNDEVHYWNEVACFARAGFAGGYCVPNEQTAPASWTHFGPHGPGFPVVFGTLARIVGWHPASGPLFNAVVLALGA